MVGRTGMEAGEVDTCMKLGAGHPMGPLALLDFVGLDVSVAIGESIGTEIPERVRELIGAGKLGRKSGEGFYTYDCRTSAAPRRIRLAGIPAARSHTTSASPIPCARASSATLSPGSVASGRSSQRARLSASSTAVTAGPGSHWVLTRAIRASRWESLSLTHH